MMPLRVAVIVAIQLCVAAISGPPQEDAFQKTMRAVVKANGGTPAPTPFVHHDFKHDAFHQKFKEVMGHDYAYQKAPPDAFHQQLQKLGVTPPPTPNINQDAFHKDFNKIMGTNGKGDNAKDAQEPSPSGPDRFQKTLVSHEQNAVATPSATPSASPPIDVKHDAFHTDMANIRKRQQLKKRAKHIEAAAEKQAAAAGEDPFHEEMKIVDAEAVAAAPAVPAFNGGSIASLSLKQDLQLMNDATVALSPDLLDKNGKLHLKSQKVLAEGTQAATMKANDKMTDAEAAKLKQIQKDDAKLAVGRGIENMHPKQAKEEAANTIAAEKMKNGENSVMSAKAAGKEKVKETEAGKESAHEAKEIKQTIDMLKKSPEDTDAKPTGAKEAKETKDASDGIAGNLLPASVVDRIETPSDARLVSTLGEDEQEPCRDATQDELHAFMREVGIFGEPAETHKCASMSGLCGAAKGWLKSYCPVTCSSCGDEHVSGFKCYYVEAGTETAPGPGTFKPADGSANSRMEAPGGQTFNAAGNFCPDPLVTTPAPSPAPTTPSPTNATTTAPSSGNSTSPTTAPTAKKMLSGQLTQQENATCAECLEKHKKDQETIHQLQNQTQELQIQTQQLQNDNQKLATVIPALNVTDPLKTLIPDGLCSNKPGWDNHCAILKAHCWDYLSMRRHCTMTCEFCKKGSTCQAQVCTMPDGTSGNHELDGTEVETLPPTPVPTTKAPTTKAPTKAPTTKAPTTTAPTTTAPTTKAPTTKAPTKQPTAAPTTNKPTVAPTAAPTNQPTKAPTKAPTEDDDDDDDGDGDDESESMLSDAREWELRDSNDEVKVKIAPTQSTQHTDETSMGELKKALDQLSHVADPLGA